MKDIEWSLKPCSAGRAARFWRFRYLFCWILLRIKSLKCKCEGSNFYWIEWFKTGTYIYMKMMELFDGLWKIMLDVAIIETELIWQYVCGLTAVCFSASQRAVLFTRYKKVRTGPVLHTDGIELTCSEMLHLTKT